MKGGNNHVGILYIHRISTVSIDTNFLVYGFYSQKDWFRRRSL